MCTKINNLKNMKTSNQTTDVNQEMIAVLGLRNIQRFEQTSLYVSQP
jgi:hypothetical protein